MFFWFLLLTTMKELNRWSFEIEGKAFELVTYKDDSVAEAFIFNKHMYFEDRYKGRSDNQINYLLDAEGQKAYMTKVKIDFELYYALRGVSDGKKLNVDEITQIDQWVLNLYRRHSQELVVTAPARP